MGRLRGLVVVAIDEARFGEAVPHSVYVQLEFADTPGGEALRRVLRDYVDAAVALGHPRAATMTPVRAPAPCAKTARKT